PVKIPPIKGGIGGCPSGFQSHVRHRTSPCNPWRCEKNSNDPLTRPVNAYQAFTPLPRGARQLNPPLVPPCARGDCRGVPLAPTGRGARGEGASAILSVADFFTPSPFKRG